MQFTYFPVDDKKARIGKTVYTEDELPILLRNYKGFGRFIPVGYIMVDVDEQPYIEKLDNLLSSTELKYCRVKTTKGVHFIFKTDKDELKDHTKKFAPIGVKFDTKGCGTKQDKKKCYEVMQLNDVRREDEFIRCSSFEEVDYLPWWLYPYEKSKDGLDLCGDTEGQRNSLFHHTLMAKIKRLGRTREEYCTLAHLINDYILNEPITEEELETACRQEAWDGLVEYDKKTKPQILDLVDEIIEFYNVGLYGNQLVFYDMNFGRYTSDDVCAKQYIQEHYRKANLRVVNMEEVLEQMRIAIKKDPAYARERSPEYILCGKHLVSMNKDEVIDNTRTIFTDVYYPYEIMTEKEFKNFDGRMKSFMREISCRDKMQERVIWERLGCMIAPIKPWGKMSVWYGSGSNGKSLLLEFMEIIMGDLMSHANILNINDSFALQNIAKGICNVTDDAGTQSITETGRLKSLIQGGKIEVNKKYKEPENWKSNTQIIMCCNELPVIKDTTGGMLRRLDFVHFAMELPDNKKDPMLLYKMKQNPDNFRYLLTGAVFAYREVVQRGKLTESNNQDELMNLFKERNQTPIDMFVDYLVSENGGIEILDDKPYDEVFELFTNFIDSADIEKPQISRRSLMIQINRQLHHYDSNISNKTKTINGKSVKVYTFNKS